MAPAPTNGEWNEVSIDLSSYVGQQGYIAIHHVSNDMNYLLVDYFGMYGESVPAGSWVTVPTTDTSVEITGLSSGTTYDYQVFGIKDNTPNEGTPLATFTTLNDNTKVFVADGDWNVDANWTPAGVPTISNPTIICANVAIPSGVVAAANTIEIDGGSVTLKDGGQLKTNTSGLDITIEKAFDANKFYFIGTALSNNINPANITDMVTDETDLYSFDAGELNEWWNYKAYPFTMNPGNGYLYATSTARTISMEGQTWKSNNNALTMSYTYDDTSTDYFNGWMLISNIYPCTGYVTYINSSYQLEDVTFYKMNATGDGYDVYQDVVELAPGEGAFMKVSSSAYVYFSSEDIGLGNRLPDNVLVLLRGDDRRFDSLDLFRGGQIAGGLAVGYDHFFLDGLRKKPDVFALVLVMIKETELVVRIGLVAFAVAGIVAEPDGREETAEPGGIALFGVVDLLFRGSFNILDFIGGGVHDDNVSDVDFAVFAGRDDRSLFDRDLIGAGVFQDHDLAVILVLQDLAFAELFDCGGSRAVRLSGGGFFRLVRRARHLG